MPRYIDADALIDRLHDYAEVNKDSWYGGGFKNAITVVEMEETADVVKVVRCEDCRYWTGEYCFEFMTAYKNAFCYWGERRDGAIQ